MKTSLVKWLIAAALVLLAGFFLLRLVRPGPHDRFLQIPPGATRAEVTAILGPPGDYRSQPGSIPILTMGDLRSPFSVEAWYFDEGDVEIAFDQDDRMIIRYWQATGRSSWFDGLLAWLKG